MYINHKNNEIVVVASTITTFRVLLGISNDPVEEGGDACVDSGELWSSTPDTEGHDAHYVVLAIGTPVVERSSAVTTTRVLGAGAGAQVPLVHHRLVSLNCLVGGAAGAGVHHRHLCLHGHIRECSALKSCPPPAYDSKAASFEIVVALVEGKTRWGDLINKLDVAVHNEQHDVIFLGPSVVSTVDAAGDPEVLRSCVVV